MQLEERINAFVALGKFLGQFTSEEALKTVGIENNELFHDRMLLKLEAAKNHNGWFTLSNLHFACKSWSEALSESKLLQWTSMYNDLTPERSEERQIKTIAIIMAGNVPLVGFHDFLSVLMSGNKALVKLSSNDKQLLPFLADYLIAVEPKLENYILFTEERLKDFDAVIATGSNNTARYFDYYFGKYPHIIRKNRNSVAVLTGNETKEQMKALADDVFRYFGLGCRNVSKIFIPKGYNIDKFFNGIYAWKEIINNNKYINNYDYNKAVYLMSGFDLLDNEFLLLKEDSGYSSPISVIYYEYYSDLKSLHKKIIAEREAIQCVVSECGISNETAFGTAQSPELWDYADGVDTLDFLLKLPL
jgi:hypothetical protein